VVEAADGQRTHSGTVEGSRSREGRIGDVTATRRYVLSGGAGSVTSTAARARCGVRLTKPANGYPAGSSVMVAVVAASASTERRPQDKPTPDPDRADPDPDPTAPAGSSGARKPPKRTLTRRRAPKVPSRLTAKRFAFPVYGRDARVADDFGAPRAMTGSHEGNDVFAPFGAPVLAVTDGELFKGRHAPDLGQPAMAAL
jgi:murein DD-endopeptidase MepM/ murein hydrolase activator NlpD